MPHRPELFFLPADEQSSCPLQSLSREPLGAAGEHLYRSSVRLPEETALLLREDTVD